MNCMEVKIVTNLSILLMFHKTRWFQCCCSPLISLLHIEMLYMMDLMPRSSGLSVKGRTRSMKMVEKTRRLVSCYMAYM